MSTVAKVLGGILGGIFAVAILVVAYRKYRKRTRERRHKKLLKKQSGYGRPTFPESRWSPVTTPLLATESDDAPV